MKWKYWSPEKQYIFASTVIFAICITLMLMAGCSGGSWKKDTVTGYEITGKILTEFYNNAKPMCDAGTINAEDCFKIKVTYNKARSAYITAGNALALAINTEDAIIKKNSLEAYQNALKGATDLTIEVINLAQTFNIPLEGGQ